MTGSTTKPGVLPVLEALYTPDCFEQPVERAAVLQDIDIGVGGHGQAGQSQCHRRQCGHHFPLSLTLVHNYFSSTPPTVVDPVPLQPVAP